MRENAAASSVPRSGPEQWLAQSSAGHPTADHAHQHPATPDPQVEQNNLQTESKTDRAICPALRYLSPSWSDLPWFPSETF